MKSRTGYLWKALVLGLWLVPAALAAPIDKTEALTSADLWYAMEVNSPELGLSKTQIAGRLQAISSHKLLFVDSSNRLLEAPPRDTNAWAYVVKYEGGGFVVLSADDRLHPVLVFSAVSPLTWDDPKRDLLPYFVKLTLAEAQKYLRDAEAKGAKIGTHPLWLQLRARVQQGASFSVVKFDGPKTSFYLLLPTAAWSQGWPYNDVVAARNGNDPGIPTGCVATALAIAMRYHAWPITGESSRSYTDTEGTVQFSHSYDYGAQTFNWSAMFTNSLSSSNAQVANLMYGAGVMVYMDYEPDWSAADADNIMRVTQHFRYWGIQHMAAAGAHIQESLCDGLPVIGCNTDHCFVIDGYRDSPSPFYHINAGYNGSRTDWYNLDFTPSGGAPGGSALSESFPYMAPDCYVYVDGIHKTGEAGTPMFPLETIAQGVAAVPSGGHLWLRGQAARYTGPGNAPITISKPMTLHAYHQESATIGP